VKTILWVDDEIRTLEALFPEFEKHGFRVLGASTISMALGILRRNSLDGVLLDVMLGGNENGLTLLEEIRHSHPHLPIVVLTQSPGASSSIRANAEGAFYLPKSSLVVNQRDDFFLSLERAFPGSTKSAPSQHSSGPDWKIWVPVIVLLLTGAGWLIQTQFFVKPEKPGVIIGQGRLPGSARIYVDNETAGIVVDGSTGFFRRELPPGSHQIRYEIPRYSPAVRAVHVTGGVETTIAPPEFHLLPTPPIIPPPPGASKPISHPTPPRDMPNAALVPFLSFASVTPKLGNANAIASPDDLKGNYWTWKVVIDGGIHGGTESHVDSLPVYVDQPHVNTQVFYLLVRGGKAWFGASPQTPYTKRMECIYSHSHGDTMYRAVPTLYDHSVAFWTRPLAD
jgi:ActR/RegA family two-component response regulator